MVSGEAIHLEQVTQAREMIGAQLLHVAARPAHQTSLVEGGSSAGVGGAQHENVRKQLAAAPTQWQPASPLFEYADAVLAPAVVSALWQLRAGPE